jgi:diguanylate cyclase (GGDEF)-like protein
MDSYERRARFIHRFGTPMTTLNAGLALLERYLSELPADPRLDEVMALLNRSSIRLGQAVEILNVNIQDHPVGIQVVVPEALLIAHQPVEPPQHQAAPVKLRQPPPAPSPASDEKPCILLIEDSATYRAIMSARLSQAGYSVLLAPDGLVGLDVAREKQPSVIILDLMLPHLTGEQVAFVLGEDPETKQIPIVIYTSLENIHINRLDPRLHIIRKDEALDNLPALLDDLIAARRRPVQSEILIIEDDPELQRVLVAGLTTAGYTITTASTGEEGLRLAARQSFDLIMLDLLLPDIDGWTLLRLLRERNQTVTTPTMLVSSLNQASEKVRGFQLGADDYVTKPFDWNELLARINASLRRREIEGSANPTTMLPGNKAIERAIMARVEADVPFAVAYCDLDNFKAFNDQYGFLKGDAIIHQTARIITAAVERYGEPGDFVGHIGGDDFVIITHPDLISNICQPIIDEFDQLAPLYYDVETRQRGFINQFDREGNPKVFPLVSISIGIVSSNNHSIAHFAEVGDLAANVKKQAKAYPGSVYFVEGAAGIQSATALSDYAQIVPNSEHEA